MFELRVGGETLIIVSMPMPDATHGLSGAELDVARAAAAGHSNAEIARRRGRSPRTIANQLASIYRKLGVGSRAELALRLLGEGA